MNLNHLHLARLATRTVSGTLLTLVTLTLLAMVWISFFLWGVRFTEELMAQMGIISPLIFKVGKWQMNGDALSGLEIAPYLPALAMLLISQLLYFYRIPRTHRRLTVTWEFVATTFLFIISHLCLWALFELISLWGVILAPELNLALTSLLLGGLFWLQWFGLVPRTGID